MTKEGITKDLESITQGIPIGPVKFNSDEHFELVRHMASEAERLGLSFGVHNCDGWTSSHWDNAPGGLRRRACLYRL